jgi:hypothetical protein
MISLCHYSIMSNDLSNCLIIFLKERGYQFAAAAAVVLAILIADFAIGTLVN